MQIVSSPIVELKKAAVALGQGNMTARVKKGTILFRDEIADLKDTFNSMANQIASHQMILEHKVGISIVFLMKTLSVSHTHQAASLVNSAMF